MNNELVFCCNSCNLIDSPVPWNRPLLVKSFDGVLMEFILLLDLVGVTFLLYELRRSRFPLYGETDALLKFDWLVEACSLVMGYL